MEQDTVMEGLDIALASVGFGRLENGYTVLEAEDRGNGFEWTDGAVVSYSNEKWAALFKTGLYDGPVQAPLRSETMMSRDDAIKTWQAWLDRQGEDHVPVDVLHEAEHYRSITRGRQ